MAYISFQPSDHFINKLYTGTGSTINVTGVGFQPDMVWLKNRDSTGGWFMYDVLRGVDYAIMSNNLDAQADYQGLTAFDSDGYTIGTFADTNTNTEKMQSWSFKAGGAGVSNGVGDITSTVSVNATAGISLVKYLGNGSDPQTIGHGLGSVPQMMIVKKFSTDSGYAGNRGWAVYHHSMGNTQGLYLNDTDAKATKTSWWQSTTPTSTVFTIGSDGEVNDSGSNYVNWCFAPVKGYSSFGIFEGNTNVDGPFIYTGFRPAYVLIKNIDRVEAWNCWDSKMNPYNPTNNRFQPNNTTAEVTGAGQAIDTLANGFKVRTTSTEINDSTCIYAAFAEFPFVSSNSQSGTAR
jgi:hypothetical protein